MQDRDSKLIFEAYIRDEGHITDPDERLMLIDGRVARVKRLPMGSKETQIRAGAMQQSGMHVWKDPQSGFLYAIQKAEDQGSVIPTHGEQIRSLLNDDEYVLGPDFITSRTPDKKLYDYVLRPGDGFAIYKLPKDYVGKKVTFKSGNFRELSGKVLDVSENGVVVEMNLFGKDHQVRMTLEDFIKSI